MKELQNQWLPNLDITHYSAWAKISNAGAQHTPQNKALVIFYLPGSF